MKKARRCGFKSRKKHLRALKEHCCRCHTKGRMYQTGVCEACAEY